MDKILKSFKLTRILDKDFEEIVGITLKKTELWEDFRKARDIRRGVIHPVPKNLTLKETNETMNVILKIIQWISKQE